MVAHPPRITRDVPKGQRKPNLRRDRHHLDFVKSLPCMVCYAQPAGDPHHIRQGTDGGAGLTPSDRYAVPLCRLCHSRLHDGEARFWAALKIDPQDTAWALWTNSGDIEAGERIVFRARQAIGLHK
jgi:hypothetical protein